jgi:hypothetical protein
MITSGVASRPPDDDTTTVASSTDVIGIPSIATVIAPIPIAAPAVVPSPGR